MQLYVLAHVLGGRDFHKVVRWQKAIIKILVEDNIRDESPQILTEMGKLESDKAIRMCDMVDKTWESSGRNKLVS